MRKDNLKVLGPGAQITGPFAAKPRTREMSRESLDWLKVDFFRTELELGHASACRRKGHANATST
ncbi:MAG: hypothetical protein ACR2RA_21235 [Geminicoccaceae bacterium]